jgi:hypothetical protein
MTSDELPLPAYAPPLGETSAFVQQSTRTSSSSLYVDNGVLFDSAMIAGGGFALGMIMAVAFVVALYMGCWLVLDALKRLWLSAMRARA